MKQIALNMPKSTESMPPINVAHNIDFAGHFQDLGLEGSIIIYDSQNERIFQHNPDANNRFFPGLNVIK